MLGGKELPLVGRAAVGVCTLGFIQEIAESLQHGLPLVSSYMEAMACRISLGTSLETYFISYVLTWCSGLPEGYKGLPR